MTVACIAVVLVIPQGHFVWGRGAHQIEGILAGHYMRPETCGHGPRENA